MAGFPNVTMLPRHPCHWGDFGHVEATLKGIAAIARAEFVYEYSILLTGQDYPLKSDVEIRSHLQQASGMSFMESKAWPIPDWENGRAIKRIQNFHVHLPFPRWARSLDWPPSKQHLTIPLRRTIPGGLVPHFGSSYWYLHRSCIERIHQFVNATPQYLKFFRRVLIPDECFFQTLLMNSELAPSIVPRTLTYVTWRPPWPGILTIEDLPLLRKSDCLFARKFAPSVDSEILSELDSQIDKPR